MNRGVIFQISRIDLIGIVRSLPLDKESPADVAVRRIAGPLDAAFELIVKFSGEIVFFRISQFGIAGGPQPAGGKAQTEMAVALAVAHILTGKMQTVGIGPLPLVVIGLVVFARRKSVQHSRLLRRIFGQHIHHAAEGRCAPQRGASAFQHFDLLNVQRRQHVPVELAGVRGIDRHAVEQQQHLVAGAERIAGGTADVDLIADEMHARRGL
ncbi:MAG: hypothetical protein BWY83_02343 [bacterium ADurb.Bin478]|nr:MAG: hypothetical protein BWY83_02343 [bacterium ADurb.Bin478]